MSTLTFNTSHINSSFANQDVLSVFKESTEKKINIHQGMSVNEISEIVSENIISVIKEQFEITKSNFDISTKK